MISAKVVQNKMFLFLLPILFAIISVFFIVFSYVLIDPNITFVNTKWWEVFRNWAVNIGYHQTAASSVAYIFFVILLFIFHFLIVKNYRKINLLYIIFAVCFVTLLSYPFLSHDFFNYMFDARIVTHYHRNPYELMPGFFYDDIWLRFMHWTDRRYPYGPTFLPLTLIPSFLGLGKFLPTFLLFKTLYMGIFIWSAYLLNKLNKKWVLIYTTHPLILIEGLVNGHLDLIALSLGIVGVYFLFKEKKLLSRLFLLTSGGIKYTTLSLIFLSRNKKSKANISVFIIFILTTLYVSYRLEIQPWYFLPVFILLPYHDRIIGRFNIFFAGLLFSYYPYMINAGWRETKGIVSKHNIILLFLAINLLYFLAGSLLSKIKPLRSFRLW